MKTEIMQKIIDKQGEIDNVRVNQLLNLNEQLSPNNFTLPIYQLEMKYNSLCSKITLLRSELASLKSQLAEAGEEKKDYSHLCCICHENYVDSDNGYDTCDSCMNRV